MSVTEFDDYYDVLDVPRNAPRNIITAAFRKLASQFHPDRPGGGNLEVMQKISAAYDTLKDEEKRQAYDTERESYLNQSAEEAWRKWNLYVDSILKKHRQEITIGDLGALNDTFNHPYELPSRKETIIRFMEWLVVKCPPHLLGSMTGVAIASIQSGAGMRLFEKILQLAPEKFTEPDAVRIKQSLENPHTPEDSRQLLVYMTGQLVKKNMSMASYLTDAGIADIAAGGSGMLFSTIITHAPAAVTAANILTIRRIVENKATHDGVRKNMIRMSALLAPRNMTLAPLMKTLAIAGIEKGGNSSLLEVLIRSAPEVFDEKDARKIRGIAKNIGESERGYAVSGGNIATLSAKLAAKNPSLTPHLQGMAGCESHAVFAVFPARSLQF